MATLGPVSQQNEGRVFYEPVIDRSAPSDAIKKRLQKEAKELYDYEEGTKYDMRVTSEDEVNKQLKAFESKSSKQKESFWGKSTTPGSFTLLRKANAKKMEEDYMDGYRYLLEEDKKEYEELKKSLESSLADPNVTPDARQKFSELLASVQERLSLTAERLATIAKVENKEDLTENEATTLATTLEETGTEIAKTQFISSGSTRGLTAVPTPRETGAMKLKKVGGEVFSTQEKIQQAQKEALEAQEKTDLVQEVLNLTFDVDAELMQAMSLEEKISDDTVKAALKAEIAKVKSLFLRLRQKPTKDLKDGFKAELEEFKKLIEQTDDFIRNNPIPVPATPAPTAAPAPTAPPTPLHEYRGWPTSIYYRKIKNQPAGWFSIKKGDLLDEQEAWGIENESFKIVFRKYLDFITSLSQDERRFVKPLIDTKNSLVDAIKDEDLGQTQFFRDALEKEVEEWKSRWTTLEAMKKNLRLYGEAKVLAQKLPEELRESLLQQESEILSLFDKSKETLRTKNLTQEERDRLSASVTSYAEAVRLYEEKIKKPLKVDPVKKDMETNGTWVTDWKTGERKLTGILRPIQVTDKNKNQQIRTVDGGHSNNPENDHMGLTVEEYAAILKNRQEAESKVILTPETLAEWPELRAAGRAEGEEIDKKVLEKFQTMTKFVRMLNRSENSFLSLYVIPSVDPDTQEMRYTATENLRKHPQKEIIKEVLREFRGIVIFDQTRQQRTSDVVRTKEVEMLKRTATGQTYNPTRDMERGMIFKTIDKKTRITSEGGMVTNEKRRPITMAEDLGNEPKPEPVMGRKLTPEEEAKKQLSLKKVHDITNAMEHWFTKDSEKHKRGNRALWSVLGAGALGAALALGMGHRENVEQLESTAAAPDTESVKLYDWMEGFADKQFIEDIKKLPDGQTGQLVLKYAPLTADPNKPSTIREDFLTMDGSRVLNDRDWDWGSDNEKRIQLYKFLHKIEELSRVIDRSTYEKLARSGVHADLSDWHFVKGVTIQQGIEKVKEKIRQADTLTYY